MKRFVKVFCVLMLVILSFSNVLARGNDLVLISAMDVPNEIRVQVNGEFLDFTDSNGDVVNPQIMNGRTMVPFRKIFNSLGVEDSNIIWDANTRSIKAVKDNTEINLALGNNVAIKKVDGVESSITLDAEPVIVNNRTLVPLRFIAESLGMKVGWDAQNRAAIVIDEELIMGKIKARLPKLFEMVSLQTTKIDTFTGSVGVSGTLEYSDIANKANNSEVKLIGTIAIVKNLDIISLDVDLKLTGKGAIYDEIAKEKLQKITGTIIVDEEGFLLKSPLFNQAEELKNKWVRLKVDNSDMITELFTFDVANNIHTTIFNENELNINSLKDVEMVLELMEKLYKNITIKQGSKGTEFSMDVDALNVLKSLGLTADINMFKDFDAEYSGTIINGVNNYSEIDIDLDLEEGTEEIECSLEIESKISDWNKTYQITMPVQKDIVNL